MPVVGMGWTHGYAVGRGARYQHSPVRGRVLVYRVFGRVTGGALGASRSKLAGEPPEAVHRVLWRMRSHTLPARVSVRRYDTLPSC